MRKLRMKRLCSLVLVLVLVFVSVPLTALAETNEMAEATEIENTSVDSSVIFAGGDGSETNPYQVSNVEQLSAVRNDLNACYIQTADIDLKGYMSGNDWIPIGGGTYDNETTYFSGIYDGNGYKIQNLYINQCDESNIYIGLFGANQGTIKNIYLEDCNINIDTGAVAVSGASVQPSIGCVAGISSTIISGCTVIGNLNIRNAYEVFVGGIAGSANVRDCINYANITVEGMDYSDRSGGVHCGGIVGMTESINGTVLNCVNYGDIVVSSDTMCYCGGISGEYGAIDSSINYGNVEGTIITWKGWMSFAANCNVGGIVGATSSDTNKDCVNFGNVSATKNCEDGSVSAGGIAGYCGYYGGGDISNCYNLGDEISSDEDAGRIVGVLNTVAATDVYSVDTTLVNGSIPTENIGPTLINGGSLTREEIIQRIRAIFGDSIEIPDDKDSSYLPSVNGWGFANSDRVDTITENAWYSIFDKSKWVNKLVYFWHKNKTKDGMCQGLAITSVLSYMDYPPIQEWKKNSTYASEFKENDLDNCRSMTYNLTLAEYIQAIHSYQFSFDAADEESKHKKELVESNYQPIIDRTNNFYDTHENPIAIVVAQNFNGSHVLIPYRVREISDETRVYVYDCNSIALDENLDDQYIVFAHDEDGNITGWSYELWPDVVFSSSNGSMTYYDNLAEMFELIRSSKTVTSAILFNSDSSVFDIITSNKDRIRYNNGEITNYEGTVILPIQIANLLPNSSIDNSAMFYLKNRDNIVIQNDNEDGNNVEFFIADDYSDFTVNADAKSATEIKMNENNYTLNTTPSLSNLVTMSYTTNDGQTVINASGIVNDTATIAAESGESKAVISGYQSGTITITHNGETTTENINSDDAIIVSVEKDGTIVIAPGEMDHIHSYAYTDNGDGTHTKSCQDGDDTSIEEHSYVEGGCEFCGAKEHVHSYEKSVFSWSDDYSSSTATFTCECDDSHTIDAKVTVQETAATCTEDGKKVYTATATYDGVTESDTKTVTILAQGHQYVETVIPPTENEQGYTEHTCSVCGDNYRDTYTDPTGKHEHTWDEGVVTKEVTCTEDGEITYTCTSCEEKKIEVIKATGHDYHNGICSKCGDKQASVPVTPVKPVWKTWLKKVIQKWIKHFWK